MVVPGVGSATANRKAAVQEGISSLASAASGDIQQITKAGVIATVIAVPHSTSRAAKDSMVKEVVAPPPCKTSVSATSVYPLPAHEATSATETQNVAVATVVNSNNTAKNRKPLDPVRCAPETTPPAETAPPKDTSRKKNL